jgi:NAD(P)-dependent dehydrogenase (short-subunit alcohol dehydrogenase family)
MSFEQAIYSAFVKAEASRIVIASRVAKKLEVTKQELLKINPRLNVLAIPTDITSEDSVNNLEEILKSMGWIPDVLVNGAGLWSCAKTIGESDPREWWADFVCYILTEPSESFWTAKIVMPIFR